MEIGGLTVSSSLTPMYTINELVEFSVEDEIITALVGVSREDRKIILDKNISNNFRVVETAFISLMNSL